MQINDVERFIRRCCEDLPAVLRQRYSAAAQQEQVEDTPEVDNLLAEQVDGLSEEVHSREGVLPSH